jgi:hypothetical protein
MQVIRAAYTADTVTVYQAYAPQIADVAVRADAFAAMRVVEVARMTGPK